jgi:DNA-directed RNA polymerase I, II, and III subunit RPABC2
MSDTESSYASDSDNSVASENEKIVINPNLDVVNKVRSLPTIDTFGDDDDSDEEETDEIDVDDEDEDEAEEEVDDDDNNNDQLIMGGAKKAAEEEEADDTESEDDDEGTNKKVVKKSKTGPSNVNKSANLQIESDDEDDDDVDDNYLQKFDSETTKNYVNEFHPECLHHNYDEVAKFTAVVRDSNNIIIDPFHKTIPYLTKYERARILGQRAKQIESGAKPLVKVPDNIVDGHIIADLELLQKKIPFIIRRPIPGGAFEYWNLKDLEIIAF